MNQRMQLAKVGEQAYRIAELEVATQQLIDVIQRCVDCTADGLSRLALDNALNVLKQSWEV